MQFWLFAKNKDIGTTLQTLLTRVRLCLQQGPVPRKMVKFNPGFSQILSKLFLSENM